MIALTRLDKPDILVRKEAEWLAHFLGSGNDRPDHRKYAHTDIKDRLGLMSHYKCFYSEYKFADNEGEVDHFVEVNPNKGLAFSWGNLYLSLKQVNNGKLSNVSIPAFDALDPCTDSDEEIERHLYFEAGDIRSHTDKGERTIRKYGLNHSLLKVQRQQKLIEFYITKDKLSKNQITQDGRPLTDDEIRILRAFAAPDYPFSLMFRLLLKKMELI